MCDRCADRGVARITGYPELRETAEPANLPGPDGREHCLQFRVWRAPTGIEVELQRPGSPIRTTAITSRCFRRCNRCGGQLDGRPSTKRSPNSSSCRRRLASRTFRNYADVIHLLRDCLNGYGHQSLDADERRRWETAYEHDEEAFVRFFGPAKIADNLGEFLDYFMIRKVMASEELLRAAGTVTTKLAKWLGVRGYLDESAVEDAVERGAAAARDLPTAEKLSGLLYEQARKSRIDIQAPDDDDYSKTT